MVSDDIKQQAIKELAQRELTRRQSGEISGSDISNHPVKSVLKTFMQPASQSLFGKNAEDVGNEIAQSKGMGQSSSKPYDKNLGMVRPTAMALNIAGQGIDVAQTPSTYAIAPALKVLGVPLKELMNVEKYAKPKNQISLAEEVQNSLSQAKHDVIESYGKDYDRIIGNSDKKVNITKPIKNFVDDGQSIMQNPEFAQQIAVKNPAANKILDLVKTVIDEKVPEELSANEANNLSKAIKNLPGIKTKLAQASKYGFHTVQWTNEDRMILNFADDIKSEVIDAHPELSSLNKNYGNFMNSYKKVAPEFKIGSTISKLKNYGSLDPQKKMMFESIIPKSTVNKIKDFERSDKISQILKKVGIGVASAAGLGAVSKEAWNLTGH